MSTHRVTFHWQEQRDYEEHGPLTAATFDVEWLPRPGEHVKVLDPLGELVREVVVVRATHELVPLNRDGDASQVVRLGVVPWEEPS